MVHGSAGPNACRTGNTEEVRQVEERAEGGDCRVRRESGDLEADEHAMGSRLSGGNVQTGRGEVSMDCIQVCTSTLTKCERRIQTVKHKQGGAKNASNKKSECTRVVGKRYSERRIT